MSNGSGVSSSRYAAAMRRGVSRNPSLSRSAPSATSRSRVARATAASSTGRHSLSAALTGPRTSPWRSAVGAGSVDIRLMFFLSAENEAFLTSAPLPLLAGGIAEQQRVQALAVLGAGSASVEVGLHSWYRGVGV